MSYLGQVKIKGQTRQKNQSQRLGGGRGGRGDGRVLNLTPTRQKVSGVYLLPDRI